MQIYVHVCAHVSGKDVSDRNRGEGIVDWARKETGVCVPCIQGRGSISKGLKMKCDDLEGGDREGI